MRLITLIAVLLSVVSLPARSDEPADKIQAVISDQISDFQRDDVVAAFDHAAPGIQEKFGSPETFGRMVRDLYPMVWRPARFEMLQLIETPAGLVQVVLFEDAFGKLHEAGYLMTEVDGVWRISGVRLRAVPGVGT